MSRSIKTPLGREAKKLSSWKGGSDMEKKSQQICRGRFAQPKNLVENQQWPQVGWRSSSSLPTHTLTGQHWPIVAGQHCPTIPHYVPTLWLVSLTGQQWPTLSLYPTIPTMSQHSGVHHWSTLPTLSHHTPHWPTHTEMVSPLHRHCYFAVGHTHRHGSSWNCKFCRIIVRRRLPIGLILFCVSCCCIVLLVCEERTLTYYVCWTHFFWGHFFNSFVSISYCRVFFVVRGVFWPIWFVRHFLKIFYTFSTVLCQLPLHSVFVFWPIWFVCSPAKDDCLTRKGFNPRAWQFDNLAI